MDKRIGGYDSLIKRLAAYSSESKEIISVFVIGSRARNDVIADEYSDLDVVMVVKDTAFFLETRDWLDYLGQHHISFIENTIGGEKERRVLFDGGMDVDFVILSEETANRVLFDTTGLMIFEKGYHTLIDKAGLAQKFPASLSQCKKHTMPSEEEFVNLVNDFWYHVVWTAKKLLRGEIWASKFCLDGYMKQKLLWLIAFHAHVKNGWNYDTWYDGRFIDTWADQRVIEGLKEAFAHYDKVDLKRALLKTMDLFRWLALEISEKAGYCYPMQAEQSAVQWIGDLL